MKNEQQDLKNLHYTKKDTSKFFIFENYSNNILKVHEEIRNRLYNSIIDIIKTRNTTFLYFLIIELVVVLASILGLLPLIFKVHKGK